MLRITSFQNARVKQIKKLRDRRERDRTQRFVIDDGRDLQRALRCGYEIDYVFYCPELAAPADHALIEQLDQESIFEVPADLIANVSYRENPSAFVAVMMQKPPLDIHGLHTAVRVLGLIDLQKPGNIGALLRTADATGFDTILLIDTSLDIYNPNIIRSSTGACFLNNIYTLSSEQALDFLQTNGFTIVAAAVDGEKSLFEADLSHKTAIMMGTEDLGLPEKWIQQANQRIRIPMVGKLADSLNVSVSGAIFMYETLRQQMQH